MAWRYECIENQTVDTLVAWLSQKEEMHQYALIDVQRLSVEQIQTIDRHQWDTAVNLYADLEGTSIASMGPRLVQFPREEVPHIVELALASRSVSFLLGQCDFPLRRGAYLAGAEGGDSGDAFLAGSQKRLAGSAATCAWHGSKDVI